MLPELLPTGSILRIGPEMDVPITPRVRRLIDSAAFRRLAQIRQLGLVSLVYPGATHSRFEHSLGVYRNAVDFLKHFANDTTAAGVLTERDGTLFLVSGLLHDVGHWPYCHAIEDLKLMRFPRHEILANRLLQQPEIADALRQDWGLEPDEVARCLDPEPVASPTPSQSLLRSMLSGPVDIDKLDYLERDSLHAGVPYGRNFDRHRLVHSLCMDPSRHQLAISEKGRTAAEMMVFARYVMFSEVYWHHAVRAATAMLQRVVYELRDRPELVASWLDGDDASMQASVREASLGRSWEACAEGLFGARRVLYKRMAQFDSLSHADLHRTLSRRPYPEIVELSRRASERLASLARVPIGENEVLIDTPPVKLEVQFDLRVRMRDGEFRPLSDLSPVVQSLAARQFDDLVKRVRVFVAPHLREALRAVDIPGVLREQLARQGG